MRQGRRALSSKIGNVPLVDIVPQAVAADNEEAVVAADGECDNVGQRDYGRLKCLVTEGTANSEDTIDAIFEDDAASAAYPLGLIWAGRRVVGSEEEGRRGAREEKGA
jgi:hypothetical protein